MTTYWVAAQDTATSVKYVVVASGDNQFPSGDLPSISEAAGPYTNRAAAQNEANILNKAPGGGLGVKSPGPSQWWFYNNYTGQVILDTDWLTAQGDMLRTKTGTGWHYYQTNADMLAAIAQNNWPAPQYLNGVAQNLANAPQIAGGVAGKVLGGTNWESWILRAGEVLLGIVLVGIALNALLHGPVQKVAGATPIGRAAKVL